MKGRPRIDIDENRELFLGLVKFKVGGDTKVRIWEDTWATDVPFHLKYPDLYALSSKKRLQSQIVGWLLQILGMWGLGGTCLTERFLDGLN